MVTERHAGFVRGEVAVSGIVPVPRPEQDEHAHHVCRLKAAGSECSVLKGPSDH